MDATATGWERFRDADWEAARVAFAAALAEQPGDPEALDGLGQALWWLGRRDEAIDTRREAYAAYRRTGDTVRAGGIAAYLAGESRIDGRAAEAAGWLARARRLLCDGGPTNELGWLEIEEAKCAAAPAEAETHARQALAVAHELTDPDVECMALAQLGGALVRQGRTEEGVGLLDEAMTVALGGETSDPLACGDACCTTLVVCDTLADVDRAAQWCEAVVEFTERRRFTPLQAWCRGIFAGVLVQAGEWERAEVVLTEALSRHQDRRRRSGRPFPLAVLADLRLRQGRPEEAAALLDGIEEEPAALASLVRLHLARGEHALAAARLGRGDPQDPAIAVLAGELALETGDTEAALGAAASLRAIAAPSGRGDLLAKAALLNGRATGAESELETAVAGFAALHHPYDEALARLELASVRARDGSPLALADARAARDAFERLGARAGADRAAAVLRELGASGRTAGRGQRDELTGREREVLALLAAGLSNPEIAERLVITPKTVEHHVGRVLAKLGVRNRAEAAAHAVRDGL
jgi:DNA-binding CsgD family transcriptional regulator